MEKQYRTVDQFEEILESMTNGNWTQAAGEAVEYGFYANDLLNALEAHDLYEEGDQSWCETIYNLVLLAEMVTEKRYKK
jgi:hypothetical protein